MTLAGIVFYAVGVYDVIKLTPLYLIGTMVLLGVYLKHEKHLWYIWASAGVIGFVAEMYGVHTGRLFGSYVYGDILGPKLYGVPLLVGLLWALVSCVIWSTLPEKLGLKRVFLLATIATIYDVALEHFATRFGLWSWQGSIPLSNGVGWFAVSLCIGLVLHIKKWRLSRTTLAILILPLQTIFFVILLWLEG